jgi:hypothetical protein
MQFVKNGFNTFKMNDSIHMQIINSIDVKKFTNPFKYKCDALSLYVCFNLY